MTPTYRIRAAVALLLLACALAVARPPSAFAADPTFTSVAPTSGSSAGGTFVTITGTGFLPGATVYIGSSPASQVTVVSPTQITATTPPGSQGSANVLVVNADRGSVLATSVFFFSANEGAFTFSGVSPTNGPTAGDTLVTITGTGFVAGATVQIGGIPATLVTWLGSSQMRAYTPANSAGSVAVSVVNPNGNSVTLGNAFTYSGTGGVTITSISPSGGLATGGGSVTITGSGFASGATVRFGTTNATNVSFVNSTQLVVTTPAAATGTVGVTVTNPNGTTFTRANGFTFGTAGAGSPTVTTVLPPSGVTGGGTTITLAGSGFTGGATVLFGGAPSPNVSFLSDSALQVVTPPNNPGPSTITVITSSGGVGTLPGGFTYQGPPGLTVTNVTPSAGPPGGGTSVTINGSGFASGAIALFGTTPAANTTVVGFSQIVATSPAGSAGTVNVTVTNPGGLTGSLPSAFTFGVGAGGQSGPVIVTSVTPSSGPSGGTVTIGGSGFVAGASALFGLVQATNVTIVSSSQITATAPPGGAVQGALSVTVVNPGGIAGVLSAAFTYGASTGAAPVPVPVPGAINLPARGFGLFVFAGGASEQLVTATGCPLASAAYYATSPAGDFVVYVPGTSISAVNAGWRVLFPGAIPANTPLIGRCS